MKGTVFIATSLDGYIATKDGGIGWLEAIPPVEGDTAFVDQLASIDVMIMGRNTFEKVLSFGKDMWAYGDIKVVVWSRGEVDIPDYRKDTVCCSSLAPKDLFAKLEKEGHKRAYIDGGFTVQKFLQAGCIHDITQSVAPIILGGGLALYGEGQPVNLKLKSSKSYDNGIVTLNYEVIH